MAEQESNGLRQVPGYAQYWWATSISEFGGYFTSLAIQVLVVTTLSGTAADVGLVNGARWLPYLVLGLLAGVFVDRVRRRLVMIVADLARGVLLVAIPLLAMTGHLTIWALAVFMALFGFFSLIGDSATQAFVPSLVPRPLLTLAHARTDQSAAVAQSSGPALAGGFVTLFSAPWAVAVDAATYLFSAAMLLTIRVQEPQPVVGPRPSIFGEVLEGLRWVYGHAILAPLALTTHAWFIFSAIAGAVFVPFALQTVGFSAFTLGLTLSLAGLGGLAGSLVSTRLGARFGAGRVIWASRMLTGLAYGLVALAPSGLAGLALVGLGQLVLGVSMGIENANSMGYRQSVTPDNLQGRMNATNRSINRGMIVVAAPLGGLLADVIGYRTTLWIAAAGFVAVAIMVLFSRLWSARLETVSPNV